MPSDRAPTLRLLAAAGTGALLAASFLPHGAPALAWLAVAPLWLAARGAPHWRAALRLGLVAGVVMGVIGYPWIVDLLHTFGELDLWLCVPLFGVFALWTAAPLAAWAAMVSAWTGPSRHVLWVMPMALSGLWWSWPMLFPFSLAMGLANRPAWIQAAELGGIQLVEVPMLLCGVLLGEAWRARGTAGLRLGAIALVLPLVSFALGSWRIASLEHETVRTVRVGLVQPNIPLLWFDRPAKLERLREPSARAETEGAELVVWPENMFPWTLNRPFKRDFSDDDRVLRRHSLPTLFGAGTAADSDLYGYNSVINMAADGQVVGRYDKIYLVPLGEEIPLVDPEWAKGLVPGMAHNFRGAGPGRLVVRPGPAGSEAPPIAFGPLVCYEDVLPAFARAVAAQPGGVEAFVNLTNDTWFGATAEPWQHLALAQLRAVEHRIPVLRAVNSGPSSLVDRAGRVVASTDLRAVSIDAPVPPEHLVVELELGRDTASAPTLYARGGWLFGHVCQASVVVVLALLWRRRRSAPA